MATRIVLRRDTAANWALANPVLGDGEPGYDKTGDLLKVGDGKTPWAALPALFASTTTPSTTAIVGSALVGTATVG